MKNFGKKLDFLIDENLIAANDLILAELIPLLKLRNRINVIRLLHTVRKLVLLIDWRQIIDYRCRCLKSGLNGIGIPDLIIAQNALQNNCSVFSRDKHFYLLKQIQNLQIQA